jgi:hypothetical protein
VRGFHKETEAPEPEVIGLHKFQTPSMEPYIPLPYIPREVVSEDYKFKQVVNYCVIQDQEGNEFYFNTLSDAMNFLGEPQYNKAIVVAHCGGRFDHQFIFQHYLCSEILRMKKVRDPMLKGHKIMHATIHNDIELMDSYNYITAPLSAFPKMFGLQEVKKGFSHSLNRPEYEDYEGPIPDKEWYDYNTMKPEVRAEFLEWHQKQVDEKVRFHFWNEMKAYCSSDVTLLRMGMTCLRKMFRELQTPAGTSIGCELFDHITIAGTAFDGVFRQYFLKEDTLIIVPRPTKDNYSVQQILWMEHLMQQRGIHITHALNGEGASCHCVGSQE